jgi:hypothetical protein
MGSEWLMGYLPPLRSLGINGWRSGQCWHRRASRNACHLHDHGCELSAVFPVFCLTMRIFLLGLGHESVLCICFLHCTFTLPSPCWVLTLFHHQTFLHFHLPHAYLVCAWIQRSFPTFEPPLSVCEITQLRTLRGQTIWIWPEGIYPSLFLRGHHA